MCGISGEISYRCNLLNRKEEFIRMQKALSPNNEYGINLFLCDSAALNQANVNKTNTIPLSFIKDEIEYTIVYSGIIYNSEEIRIELLKNGYTFDGHTDEEIVLKAFIQYGDDCVKLFNGVFSFAIWNTKQEKLFFARDRFGIKPLFYSLNNGNFIFASEIKGLLQNDEIEAEIDMNSIMEIMFIGPGRTEGYGVYNNISEVKPATCGYFSKDGLELNSYWSLEAKEHTDSFEQTVEKVRHLVLDSIKRQLVADEPVCTMLSGGLDSSIISSVADKYFYEKGQQLSTFTVAYTDNDKYFKETKFQPNSDTQFIGIMNNYLSAKNHVIEIGNQQLAEAIYKAVEARDLPGMADIDSSLLLFCSEIRNYAKIAVSGECSDEIFGGYPWYRDKTIRSIDGFPWAQTTDYRKTFLKEGLLDGIDPNEYVYNKYKGTVNDASKLISDNEDDARTREMMRLNLDWFMQTLIERSDRMSSYSSLEIRVPYCDYRIVEYMYNVPWKYKDYKNYEKGLLREAVKDLLPDEILWRKKSPYPKTHNPQYLNIVKQQMIELINNPSAPIFDFIKKEALEKLIYENTSQPFYGQLMTTPQTIAYFLQVNYWLEKYNIKIKL